MKSVLIETQKKKQIVDITELVEKQLNSEAQGVVNLFLIHTTAALTTADLDPGTDLDMLDAFEKLIPEIMFRHPHNPSHTPDHILSSLIGTSLSVPFKDGKLVLGTWQKVILVELDGPRERTVLLTELRS